METVTIYTDGSSRGNPGPGGFAAICIYPDSKDMYHVTELGGRDTNTTNNRMELQGLIVALENMKDYYQKGSEIEFSLFIDSSYVLKGAKEWLKGWKNKNWMTSAQQAVKNSDLWRKVDELLIEHKYNGISFKWNLIKGHAGIPGNERCDIIATTFADNEKPDLYKGTLLNYSIPTILETRKGAVNSKTKEKSEDGKSKSKSSKSKSSKAAYSYVSYVNGEINTDKTWDLCEARVKGKSGAKYKKAFDVEEELDVIPEFLTGN